CPATTDVNHDRVARTPIVGVDSSAFNRPTAWSGHVKATPTDESVVRIGARVRVRYSGCDEDDEFWLASDETDGDADRLSADAPLGRALLGLRVGDHVRFRAPGGIQGVTVVAIG